MKVIKLTEYVRDNEQRRPMIYYLPVSKIEMIKSQLGSHMVYCEVNGIRVDESVDEVIKAAGLEVTDAT